MFWNALNSSVTCNKRVTFIPVYIIYNTSNFFYNRSYEVTTKSRHVKSKTLNLINIETKKKNSPTIPTTHSPLYTIVKITKEGKVHYESLSIGEILRGSSMHARDLFSLALTSHYETIHINNNEKGHNRTSQKERRPPAAIMPRSGEIIISFGNIRALIGKDSGIIFDAHKPTIQLLAKDLAKLFEYKMIELNTSNDGKNNIIGNYNKVRVKYHSDPFEFLFVEEILCDVCETFSYRLRIYGRIVDSLLSRVADDVLSESGVHSLVPIKDSLQVFEMHVKSCLECLTHMLDNDEDMLGILLLEKIEASTKGEAIEHRRHESVELLFEEYARQLNSFLQEINFHLRRVQSMQVFTSYLMM